METSVLERPATIEFNRTPADHAHHWRIDEANGPLSAGRCKICGATRAFKNWLSEGDFITNEEHRAVNVA